MKYLLPDFLLIIFATLFPVPYIYICIYLFEGLYQISSLTFFIDHLSLAFPLMSLVFFMIFGYARHIFLDSMANDGIEIRSFLKENAIFIIVGIAFILKMNEAIHDPQVDSPYWPIQSGKLLLLINLVSTFCISSVFLHLFFSIKSIFLKNRSV